MKKNLLISAIIVAIVVATVAIAFASWDMFQKKENVTFNTGDNVSLNVAKDDSYTTNDVLVPNKAIKQNANYKYEVVLAKDIELSVTGAATIDTVDYVWSLTKAAVEVKAEEPAPADEATTPVIKDVDTFNQFFTIVMRPADATDDTTDIALGGKLTIGTKYDLVVKFINDADLQVQKVDADGKKLYAPKAGGAEVNEENADYLANPDDYAAVMVDFYGDKYQVSEFKVKEIKLEITFDAENQEEPVVTPEA